MRWTQLLLFSSYQSARSMRAQSPTKLVRPLSLSGILSSGIALLCCPTSAHAGHYSNPVYSNGIVTVTNNGSPSTTNYSLSNGVWGGRGQCSWVNKGQYSPQPTSGGVTCSGAIQATFTWMTDYPGEPAPPVALILESCSASYSSNGAAAPTTAQCANGLGSPVTTSGSGGSVSGASNGSRWTIVQNPGTTLQLPAPCNASVNIAGQGAMTPLNAYTQGNASVSYQAQAYSVRIALGGITPSNGQDNILIGQGVQASLATDAPVTFSDYAWSTNDTSTFLSFDISPGQTTGHMIPCPASTWFSATPSWRWYAEGNGTVTCSAVATDPATGQNIGTVNISHPVTVWTPYSKLNKIIGPVSFMPGQTEVFAGTPVNGVRGTPPGIEWAGSVGTEDLFRGPGVGQWCFMQLASLNRHVNHFSGSPFSLITNDALDNRFSIYGNYWDADSDAALSAIHRESDSPGQGLGTNASSYSASDGFKTWMMYMPPDTSYGVQWVPIQSLTWGWGASGSRTTAQQLFPTPPGSVTAGNGATEHQFPDWTTKFVNQ